MRTINAMHYVTPLREGGSLPAIVEGDDDGTYVLKFRGAGQGPRALVAELVSGELARLLGLPLPEIVFAAVDPRLAKTEPDPEIQDLLRQSEGINLALDYLPGSITFDPLVDRRIEGFAALASRIVWFDALVTNVDRTPRNTNLLVWHGRLWLIDHGASLYFHHNWSDDFLERAGTPFPAIREHVLLPWAATLDEADRELADRITAPAIDAITALVPEEWLEEPGHRDRYRDWLLRRLQSPRKWVEEAASARALLL